MVPLPGSTIHRLGAERRNARLSIAGSPGPVKKSLRALVQASGRLDRRESKAGVGAMGVGPIEGMDKGGKEMEREGTCDGRFSLLRCLKGEEPCCSGTATGFPGRR